MPDRPTGIEDFDDATVMTVEKHLLAALEAAGLDYHYLDAMLDKLDDLLEIAAGEDYA